LQVLTSLKHLITIQLGAQKLDKDITDFGQKLVVKPNDLNKGDNGIDHLGTLDSPYSPSSGPQIGDLSL